MADAPAESLAAGQRLMLRSCGVNNPSEGVYEAATEAIRDRCPDPKPLMQVVVEVRDALRDNYPNSDMDESRSTMITQALLMKAVYTEQARIFKEDGRPMFEVNPDLDAIDLAHKPGWNQDREPRYCNLLDCSKLTRAPPVLLRLFDNRLSFREVTAYLHQYAFDLVRESPQVQEQGIAALVGRAAGLQDVFVSTLHAMFYGIVHDKFEIEGERDPPQARRWETICSLPEHVAQGLENRDEFYWVDGLRDIRRREAADAAAAAAGTATGTVTAAAAAAAAAAPAATAATE